MKYLNYFETFVTGDFAFDGFLIESKGIPQTVKFVTQAIMNGKTRFTIDDIDLKVNNFVVDLDFKITTNKPQANLRINKIDGNVIEKATLTLIMKITDLDSSEMKRLLTHEVLHMYEIYQRLQNYKPEKNGLEWQVSNTLQSIKSKYAMKSEQIYNFIMILYLAFDHEINARVAETYSVLIETRNNIKEDLYNVLIESNAWNCYERIANYSPNLSQTDYPIFIEFFNELNSKTNNLKDFVIYQQVNDNSDVDKILKEYKKSFKKKANKFKIKMIRIIDEVIKDVDMIIEKYDM